MLLDVIFVSQYNAEKIQPRDTDALISITEGKGEANLNNDWKHLIRVEFHDVDETNEELWTFDGKKQYIQFTEDIAKKIRDFVENLHQLDDAIHLVVHCHAGISRSAAVAKYVAERYALKFPSSYAVYNRHVYSTLKGLAWREKYKGQLEDE